MNSILKRVSSLAVGVALLAALGLASCSDDRQVIHMSGPVYSSVEDLTAAADVVVVATATDSARRVVEGAGEREDGGIPMMYRVFTVNEVILDPHGFISGDTIDVSLFDTDELIAEQESEIATGDKLLMFLDRVGADEQVAAGETNTIKPLTQVFSPLSSDNGIFDVTGADAITARSSAIGAGISTDTLDTVRETVSQALSR